ncbi:LLM class flavin-dependent oxidoreductase [Pseudonocardia acidicola]|uniref:LLM class flavin-dependent oxidoreductase n=1 Tax=Pseudonocardia acidicola TaxID=2724939 RepID=A0ABX1SF66_9PSEU|nr:LLM class flavin-dependent oxidoreductase [Pseudonocardia acidicola]NMI00191.1 LLM class flavin-dependent oxidoreductase [Pseudonocardia acidicola]
MVTPQIGVMLPISDPAGNGTADIAAAARHLESVGVDAVWAGDHLAFHTPIVESSIVLATAAAVTTRVRLGFGVLLLALRPPAWAAKQVSSLQVVSGGRLVLGVGVGGENPAEWAAAGVPLRERRARTDAVLRVLPDLLRGRSVQLPDPYEEFVPALLPCGGMPPLWVGGRSDQALRRAARFGDGWLGMWADEGRIGRASEQLRELAEVAGRPRPRTGLLVFVHVGGGRNEPAEFIAGQYQIPYEKVERYVATGSVDQVAERLAGLAAAGVDEFLLFPAAADHRRQYDLIGEVVRRLRPGVPAHGS